MKKRSIILLVVIAALAVGVMFPFLQAAHYMKEYLRLANPHFASYVKMLAGYNPIGANFYMTITDDSAKVILLECVSDGLIIDEIRTDQYLKEHGIPTQTQAEDGSYGNLLTYWKYDDPAEPMFSLTVYGRGSISATDEEDIEAAMKARLLAHYEQHPDTVTARLFRCRDHHQIEDTSYRITVNITAEADFAKLVQNAEMTKETIKR